MQNISSSLFQNRRALIADPDVPFVRSLKTFLEALGFEVRSAGSAEEAERMALESPPDLLITEILLEHPDSGFILAHRLRRRSPLRSVSAGDPVESGGIVSDSVGDAVRISALVVAGAVSPPSGVRFPQPGVLARTLQSPPSSGPSQIA